VVITGEALSVDDSVTPLTVLRADQVANGTSGAQPALAPGPGDDNTD
jgi:hypothetical protein